MIDFLLESNVADADRTGGVKIDKELHRSVIAKNKRKKFGNFEVVAM